MSLTLEIVTPLKKVYSASADSVTLPALAGEIGVLPGHRPLIAVLQGGELQAVVGGKSEFLAVDKGFVRVQQDVVSVLTESAIEVDAINTEAVLQAKQRAELELEKARQEDVDPSEIERLETVARFALIQELIKNKRR